MVGGALGCDFVSRGGGGGGGGGRKRLLVGLLEWRKVVCDMNSTHSRQGSTALRPYRGLTL